MGEGFAYFCWARTLAPGLRGFSHPFVDRWAKIAPRDWWWCSGCYDWHWSPVGDAQ